MEEEFRRTSISSGDNLDAEDDDNDGLFLCCDVCVVVVVVVEEEEEEEELFVVCRCRFSSSSSQSSSRINSSSSSDTMEGSKDGIAIFSSSECPILLRPILSCVLLSDAAIKVERRSIRSLI